MMGTIGCENIHDFDQIFLESRCTDAKSEYRYEYSEERIEVKIIDEIFLIALKKF